MWRLFISEWKLLVLPILDKMWDLLPEDIKHALSKQIDRIYGEYIVYLKPLQDVCQRMGLF